MASQPWERQEGESTPAWEAFRCYRDRGLSRSTAKVARDLGKSKRLMDAWSSEWAWVERVRAWDAHLDAEARKAQEEAVREMAGRHARLAVAVLNRVGQRLVGDAENGVAPVDLNRLNQQDLIRWFVEAVKVERLARGVSTQHVRQCHPGRLDVGVEHDRLEHDRLARLIELTMFDGLKNRCVEAMAFGQPVARADRCQVVRVHAVRRSD